ncbi:sulfotransferase family protein [filamentous cyanobacterium CCP2]|nr:sulfotransferase family protein [filamentous cyanobacterium CCP2]
MTAYRYEQKGKKLAYLTSLYEGFRNRSLFNSIGTYCMFIGYPRSGHSLLGSLLDAHPNAVISHELDALGFLESGFSKNQLFSLILRNDKNFTQNGREWTDYKYVVPNQYQGSFKELCVIGDKKGRVTTERLARNPSLLEKLKSTLKTRVKVIHVLRNPYDNISTIYRRCSRSSKSLSEAIEVYFFLCQGVADIKEMVDETEIIDIRHETFVEDPQMGMKQLIEFLDIDYTSEYLRDCASIVKNSPHKSRLDVDWTNDLIRLVELKAKNFEFLEGYQFDS